MECLLFMILFLIHVYLTTWAKGVRVSRRHLHKFVLTVFYYRLRLEMMCT